MTIRIAVLTLLGACLASAQGWPPAVRAQQPAKPAATRPPRKHLHDRLPITHWDLKLLEQMGTLVSTTYEAANNRVVWVIEAETFENLGRIIPHFYDDEGGRLQTGAALQLTRLPRGKQDKTQRLQVVLKLPGPDVLKEAFRVVMEKLPGEDGESRSTDR